MLLDYNYIFKIIFKGLNACAKMVGVVYFNLWSNLGLFSYVLISV